MSKPAYEEMELSEEELVMHRHLDAVTAHAKPLTLDALKRKLEDTGPDETLLDTATHLSMEEYRTFEGHFKAAKRAGDVFPRHSKIRRRH